jgi:hypothetical protein
MIWRNPEVHNRRFFIKSFAVTTAFLSFALRVRFVPALYNFNREVLNGSLRTRRPEAANIALQSAGSADG